MKRSTDRILTTHTGSLPRPRDLVEIYRDREEDRPIDQAALDSRVHDAVEEVVAMQLDAGIDVVNDGEQGKASYALYVKDRVEGF
jgi:5-methyltetrahydropteroyltriglutamate--homocysteine methyltransferase